MGKKRRPRKSRAARMRRQHHSLKSVTMNSSVSVETERLRLQCQDNPGNLDFALELAHYYAITGQETALCESLTRFEDKYPFDNSDKTGRFDRLLAFGYWRAGRYKDVEACLERVEDDGGSALDHHFLAALVNLSMREYGRAIEAAQQYVELIDSADQTTADYSFAATPALYCRLLNTLGQALAESGEFDAAQDAYERAIAMDEGNQLPYLNLASLLARQNRQAEAIEIIERGEARCRESQELRLFRESMTEQPTISACMIVKNEEELLPECLESIRDWVTEIVVVDTGSTDRTVEIAEEYGARVYHQKWENNFSKHRNYSIELAECDWVFIIDADERFVLDDVLLIKDVMRRGEFEMISVSVYNEYSHDKDLVTFSNSVRFFKRDLNLRYSGIVHNELQLAQSKQVLRTPARLRHLGYGLTTEQMEQKFKRTRELIQQQLKENPDNVFALFNYAQLLRGASNAVVKENMAEIIKAAARVVELTSPDEPETQHLHLMCLNHLAAAYLIEKNYEAARKYAQAALDIRPDYLDAIIHLAFVYYELKDYEAGIVQFEKYLKAQADFDGWKETLPIILACSHSRDLAYSHIGILYELSGETEAARQNYLKALEITPGYKETATWLGRSYLAEGDLENAEKYFQHQLNHSAATVEALLGLASIHEERREMTEAERLLAQATECFPDNSTVFLVAGKFQLRSAHNARAIAFFDRAIEIGEETRPLAVKIANACFESARFEQAAHYYRQAIEAGEPSSELHNDLGNCHFKQEEFSEAESQYLKACDITPTIPQAYRNLGLTQTRLGKSEQAISALSRYLEVSSDEPEIRLLLADQYRAVGDFDPAIEQYENLLTTAPNNMAALLGLSESYCLMGHRDAARLGFQRLLVVDPECQLACERLQQLSGASQKT